MIIKHYNNKTRKALCQSLTVPFNLIKLHWIGITHISVPYIYSFKINALFPKESGENIKKCHVKNGKKNCLDPSLCLVPHKHFMGFSLINQISLKCLQYFKPNLADEETKKQKLVIHDPIRGSNINKMEM